MKYSIPKFTEFILEKRKWETPLNGLTLDQVTALPSYKNLSKYGLDDISSELQKARLNFRFELKVENVDWVESPNKFKRTHIMIFDVNQRSGRIQMYSDERQKGQPGSGGSNSKFLNRPIETLKDYTIMFDYIAGWIEKRMAKSSDTGYRFYRHGGNYKFSNNVQNREERRINHTTRGVMDKIW